MTEKKRVMRALAAAAVLHALLSSCAPLPAVMVRAPRTIRIMDAKENRPIEGAVVLRSWDKRSAVMPSGGSSPLTFRETRSDAKGRARFAPVVRPYLNFIFIPIVLWNWTEENPLLVYKPGYKYEIVGPETSAVRMERVPDSHYCRSEEAANANSFVYWKVSDTTLMNEVLAEEAEEIKHLPKDVPGVLYFEGIRTPKDYYVRIGDVAIDNLGRLHVASSSWPRSVSILTPSGDWTGMFFTDIDPDNRSRSGGGISLSSDETGNVYVFAQGKITRFKHYGMGGPAHYVSVAKIKPYEGRFIVRGRDIFVIGEGQSSLYPADPVLHHYDLGGNLLCRSEAEPDFLFRDLSFAVDSDTVLVAGNSTRHRGGEYDSRIIRYDTACRKISSFTLPWARSYLPVTSFTSLPRGGFVVSTGDRFYVYDRDSTLLFEEALGGREMGRAGISRVRSDAAGERLYFVDSAYGRVLVYDLQNREFPTKPPR